MLSAFYLTFRRANLSLMGCTSAEPISVSVRSKVQPIKLYLQTVEIPNHFQFFPVNSSNLYLPTKLSKILGLKNTWLLGGILMTELLSKLPDHPANRVLELLP